ncbi:MAG: hypothetical protein KF817_06800 [Phycisphaeraceae bacterium]|nr:hypothetical protein [Phycisphaeraceae bacterium]
MEPRLGQLLVEAGVLSASQVARILEAQAHAGEPFGLLAERLFGVDPVVVENAWADQYVRLSRCVDPRTERIDPDALAMVTPRQAWQFRVLPIRFEPCELMLATTREHLRRALRFAVNVLGVPAFVVLSDPLALGEALCRHMPMPGLTPAAVSDGALERLLTGIRGVA